MCRRSGRPPRAWALICPSAQSQAAYSNNIYNIRDVLFNPQIAWGAFSKLALPAPLPQARDVPLFPTASKKGVAKLSRLEMLPVELLCMIVAQSSLQKSDIVALGLSSTLLWAVVVSHVQASYRMSPAPWAGRMFWCQDSYIAELPDAFLAQAREDAEKGEEWAVRMEKMSSAGQGNMCRAQRFFLNAKREYETVVDVWSHEEGWIKAAREHRASSGIQRGWWKAVEGGLAFPELWPLEREWVLRNLTTREFVEAGGLSERARKKKRKGTINFDDVLLLRTYWSAQNIWNVVKIRNGGWVGHRFDIVTGAKHRAQEAEGGWKDVTEEVFVEAEILWKKVHRLIWPRLL